MKDSERADPKCRSLGCARDDSKKASPVRGRKLARMRTGKGRTRNKQQEEEPASLQKKQGCGTRPCFTFAVASSRR